jgi:CubicO group peptidase (beta-lactamase class C family)
MAKSSLSKSRLERLHEVLAAHVNRGDIPGLVALVSRDEDTHLEVLGKLAIGDSSPVKRDTIFRIASLSKPITAVAAMILIEECKIRLDDSIEPWIPELSDRRVLKSLSSHLEDTVPANRAITVRDLLTFRLGIGSIMAPPDTYPIQKPFREYRIGGDGPPEPDKAPPTDEWLRRLGSLPLMAQPGERWMYHVGSDVLGVLIGRVSGKSLGEFMRERIFEPLGMKDTGFQIPAKKIDRIPAMYRFNHQTKSLDVFDDAKTSAWLLDPPFESGGGGLVSTVDDHFAFSQMLLGKGKFGRERILCRASVELMTSDQLTPELRAGNELFFGENSTSWGFGMAVEIRRREIYGTPGRFGWNGGFGTTAYTDPAERMIGILFTQRMMDSPSAPKVFTDFWTLAYAAMK